MTQKKNGFKTSHGLGIKGLDMAILVVALKSKDAGSRGATYYLCICFGCQNVHKFATMYIKKSKVCKHQLLCTGTPPLTLFFGPGHQIVP